MKEFCDGLTNGLTTNLTFNASTNEDNLCEVEINYSNEEKTYL
jgi:hypothetical protein